jgi:hypothetical protein
VLPTKQYQCCSDVSKHDYDSQAPSTSGISKICQLDLPNRCKHQYCHCQKWQDHNSCGNHQIWDLQADSCNPLEKHPNRQNTGNRDQAPYEKSVHFTVPVSAIVA